MSRINELLNELQATRAATVNARRKAEATLIDLQQDTPRITQKIQDLTARSAEIQTRIVTLQADEAAKLAEIHSYQHNRDSLNASVGDARTSLRNHIATLLDTRISRITRLQEQPERRPEEAEERLLSIQTEYYTKFDDVDRVLKIAQKERTEKQLELNRCRGSLRDQERFLARQQTDLDTQETHINKIRNEIAKLQRNEQALQARIASLEKTEQGERSKIDQADARRIRQLGEYQTILTERRSQIDQAPTPEALGEAESFPTQSNELTTLLDHLLLADNPARQEAFLRPVRNDLATAIADLNETASNTKERQAALQNNTAQIAAQQAALAAANAALERLNVETAQMLASKLTTEVDSNQVNPLNFADPSQDPSLVGIVLTAAARVPGATYAIKVSGTLNDAAAAVMAEGLRNPDLHVITLNIRKTGVTDTGFSMLFAALNTNPTHLQVLNISKNNLAFNGSQVLGAYLGNPQTALKNLDCSAMQGAFNNNMCNAIGLGLRTNQQLTDFNFSDNQDSNYDSFFQHVTNRAINNTFLRLFSRASENPQLPLERITLRGTPCMREAETVTEILNMIASATRLKELSLVKTECNDATALQFLSRLVELPTTSIEDLDIRANRYRSNESGSAILSLIAADKISNFNFDVSPEWGARLPRALAHTHRLSSLCIRVVNDERNPAVIPGLTVVGLLAAIDNRPITLTAFNLPFGNHNSSLQVKRYFETHNSFNFSGAFQDPDHLQSFLQCLLYNPLKVVSLDFSHSNIRNVDTLVQTLPRFPNLQTLKLYDNRIDRNGCERLLIATGGLNHIRYICLHKNALNPGDVAGLVTSACRDRLWLLGNWELSALFSDVTQYDPFTSEVKGTVNRLRLHPNNEVSTMDWSYQDLSVDDLQTLINGRAVNNTVRRVDLTENPKLGIQALRLLTNMIQTKTTALRSLNLTNIGINLNPRDQEALHIFYDFLRAVANSVTLVNIEMADNQLGDSAVIHLGLAISNKRGFLDSFGGTNAVPPNPTPGQNSANPR